MVIKRLLVIAALLLFTFLTTRPLFSSGFFPMHDDAQIARVVVMGHALGNGQFPVRLVGDLGYGYGYPLFNFYGPLPYYLGGTLYRFGVSALVATKIMIISGILLSGITMYILSSSLFGVYAGVFSAALYMFLPYRAVQLYVRGAIGELWASAFIPLFAYGVVMVWKKRPWRGVILGGVGLAGIILSHTVFGYIAGGVMGLLLFSCGVFLWIPRIRPLASRLLLLAVVGLGLSAFFWLPAFTEIQYTNVLSAVGKSADYHDHFVCFFQFWDSPWGFGGSAPGCIDGVSFKIGKVHILLFFLTVLAFFLFRKKEKEQTWIIGTCCIGIVLSVWAMTSLSVPVWDSIPYSTFIQYPWRLLAVSGFFIAWVSGYLLYRLPKRWIVIGMCLACGMVIAVNMKVFTPQYLYEKPLDAYESVDDIRYRASGVSDEYLPSGIPKPKTKEEVITERFPGATVIRETETEGVYTLESQEDGAVTLSMAYFPGWQFWVNGSNVEPDVVHGMPSVILSKGVSEVVIRFTDTPVRTAANSITLGTCLVIIALYVKKIYGRRRYTRL